MLDVKKTAQDLLARLSVVSGRYREYRAWYEGTARLPKLGLSIPPTLGALETMLGWPSVTVEAITERSEVKNLIDRESDESSEGANKLFEFNSMDSQTVMFIRDKLIYGRAFFVVGPPDTPGGLPVVTVESPLSMAVRIDPRTRRITAALKIWMDRTDPVIATRGVTLYLPDRTCVLSVKGGKWVLLDEDVHNLGRVPVVMAVNRQRTGDWDGLSEMKDIVPVTAAAVRALTGLQYGLETTALPRKYVLGATPEDFQDPAGNPLSQWESYMTSVWALSNEKAKVGTLAGADMSAFREALDLYGRLASSVTGFPSSYFGNVTSIPQAEGAIRAAEARLVKTVERSNAEVGKAISWVVDIATRMIDGEWPVGNSVRVEWQDPGTPTFAQKADALQKLAGGRPILSLEGTWDEMGWSEARKNRERQYFEAESTDSALLAVMGGMDDSGSNPNLQDQG
ncbi:phage portal protein [Actinotignum schaalii]|uniref:phage portal protein n=2 Tax=Actinomycetaceae TaxID=2049 RepID=UPI00237D5681|nr:phage portal protein [Actinotignum sanguinis]MDE1552229.1 phage portal protein [Actinotignum sanguinis]